MATTKAPLLESYQTLESSCECEQLIAKVREQDLELKCNVCKRILVIRFPSIEG